MIRLTNKYLKIWHKIHSWLEVFFFFYQTSNFIVFNLSKNCVIFNTYGDSDFDKKNTK